MMAKQNRWREGLAFDKKFTRFVSDKQQEGKRDQQQPYVRADGGRGEQGSCRKACR